MPDPNVYWCSECNAGPNTQPGYCVECVQAYDDALWDLGMDEAKKEG